MPTSTGRATNQDPTAAISVVIAAYNAAKTLSETLDSLLTQTRPAHEIIVVDDGSTDGTRALLSCFNRHIKVIAQENCGLATARNIGCNAASGAFIALIDADDVAHRDRLRVQSACLEQFPHVALSYSDFSAFSETINWETSHMRNYYSALCDSPPGENPMLGTRHALDVPALGAEAAQHVTVRIGNMYAELAHGNFVHPPTIMFQRDVFNKAGAFNPEFKNGADWDWIVRASRIGPFAFIDARLLAYRLSAGQMSGKSNRVPLLGDTVAITERICSRDKELFLRDKARFQRELCLRNIDLADAYADQGERKALIHIAKAIKLGGPKAVMVPVLAKALLPQKLVAALRQGRRSN